jgi:hypothetical protein
MKRILLGAIALVATFSMATAANAGNAHKPGTKFYVGKGGGVVVSFHVTNGSVRRALVRTKPTPCEGSGKPEETVFKAWAAVDLVGSAFKDKSASREGSRFLIAGHVRRSKTSGRARSLSVTDAGARRCDSGTVRWSGERVSFKEWKSVRRHYGPQPPK